MATLQPALGGQWNELHAVLERAGTIRLDILAADVASHEEAITGQTTALCRVYTRTDPSFGALMAQAKENAASGPNTGGAFGSLESR